VSNLKLIEKLHIELEGAKAKIEELERRKKDLMCSERYWRKNCIEADDKAEELEEKLSKAQTKIKELETELGNERAGKINKTYEAKSGNYLILDLKNELAKVQKRVEELERKVEIGYLVGKSLKRFIDLWDYDGPKGGESENN